MYVVTHTMRSHALGAENPRRADFAIRDEAYPEVLSSHRDSCEVMRADQVDRRLDRVDPKGACSLESAPESVEERPKVRILTAKVVIDAVNPAGVCLLPVCEPPATARTDPQRFTSWTASARG